MRSSLDKRLGKKENQKSTMSQKQHYCVPSLMLTLKAQWFLLLLGCQSHPVHRNAVFK